MLWIGLSEISDSYAYIAHVNDAVAVNINLWIPQWAYWRQPKFVTDEAYVSHVHRAVVVHITQKAHTDRQGVISLGQRVPVHFYAVVTRPSVDSVDEIRSVRVSNYSGRNKRTTAA